MNAAKLLRVEGQRTLAQPNGGLLSLSAFHVKLCMTWFGPSREMSLPKR